MTREEFLNNLPHLVQSYQTSSEALERIRHIILLMIIGPSGVGKTSLIKRINIPYVPSDTTRPARPEEIEGEDFFFRDDYEKLTYDIKNGGFVQIAVDSGGDLKATRALSYPAFGFAVGAFVADVVPQFRKLGFERTISAYIVPPNLQEWMKRMGAHNLDQNQLEKRMAEAQRSLKFALSDDHMHFILNDVLDDAVSQTNSLLSGNINKVREEFAKQAATQIYQELISAHL